ncbi:unnamed protein product [Notodromas monacha]|uniref:C-CAP/cofactor C-like domain-containing protein n=1 Tax=Notodromas monacha TaxID=399045 RepID=A0A7R9GAG4_9CRUS|nr:unnamed protein product [Notodromas monacha]CAG0914059.1 unnamed protein product [Notodromas monacha]
MNNINLQSCVGRLERITVTLEKMGGSAVKGKTDLESLINRLEKVMPNLRSGSEEKALDDALGEINRFMSPTSTPSTAPSDPFFSRGPVPYSEFAKRGGGETSMRMFSSNHVSEHQSSSSGRGPPSFYSRTKTEEYFDGNREGDKNFYKLEEEVNADGPQTGRIHEKSSEVQGSPPPPESRSFLLNQWKGPRRWSETGFSHQNNVMLSSCVLEPHSPSSNGSVGNASTYSGLSHSSGLSHASEYDNIVQGSLARYLSLSNTIGGDVATHAQMVARAFSIQKKFLDVASRCKQPSDVNLQKLLTGTSEAIMEIQGFREKHRSSPLFNHLSALSEGIPALGWVAVSPTPGPHVKEMADSAQFYTNRVLKDWKEKDKTHAEWVKALLEIFADLQTYIKQHHTTGLVWNNRSGSEPSAADFAACGSVPSNASVGPSGGGGGGGGGGLKKVTADMQTHKNPELRTANTVPTKSTPQPVAPAAGPGSRIGADPTKSPNMELVNGKKWMVEHQNGNEGLVINVTAINQAVYIFRCTNTVVQVKGKLSSVVMDSCKKTAVVFDTLVGPAEFVNCQSCKLQITDTVPIVSIDNCDGIQMFLSAAAKDAVKIVTSKSSEMNVMVPKRDGDFVEYPIPEQFSTTVTADGLTTVVADSTG